MSKFKLEVLVWAADPRDRMVFLSGRKFVEGQSLDGKVIVERINEDGIVLGYQGQRVRGEAAIRRAAIVCRRAVADRVRVLAASAVFGCMGRRLGDRRGLATARSSEVDGAHPRAAR